MLFNLFTWILEHPPKVDNAHEHIDPGIRMADSPVMLSRSEASRCPAHQTFAEFTLSETNALRVTVEGSFHNPHYFLKLHNRPLRLSG